MKILFITNEIPYPPDNGVKIVSYHAMRLMFEAGHSLALAVLSEENDNTEYRMNEISKFCSPGMTKFVQLKKQNKFKILLKSIINGKLFFLEKYYSSYFEKQLMSMVSSFNPDTVHFDLITMTQYVECIPSGIGTVASINDSYSLGLKSALQNKKYKNAIKIYRNIEYLLCKDYEKNIYTKFGAVHLMSSNDANYLIKLNDEINTQVIPNGVNKDLFKAATKNLSNRNIIFVANLSGGNLVSLKDFIEQSWRIVHEKNPDLELHIVGKVGDEAEQLKRSLENRKDIVFHGYIEDLNSAYEKCAISIAPINKDFGLINKAIEAMAAGLVVIGFDKTFSGIKEGLNKKDFLIAEDYTDMASLIIDLIENKNKLETLRKSAHQLALNHYTWESRAKPYQSMYQTVASKAKMNNFSS